MNKTFECAFYGTLRDGMFNYRRLVRMFEQSSMEYLRTTTIGGYQMYNIENSYPGIRDSLKENKITVDIFRISEMAYIFIKDMEEGAGYFEDTIEIEGKSYIIFPYGGKILDDYEVVKSGNWKVYFDSMFNSILSTKSKY